MDFEAIKQMICQALTEAGWRRERVECFVAMLQALFLAQSVNTHRLASRMGSATRSRASKARFAYLKRLYTGMGGAYALRLRTLFLPRTQAPLFPAIP